MPGQVKTVCSNVPVDMEVLLFPTNSPAGTTFSWGVPVMSDGSSQGTSASGVSADPAGTLHLTDVLENYGTTPVFATYTITPVSTNLCTGDPVDVVITVNPEPAAPVISGKSDLCTGETNVVYTVPLHTGSSYTWTVPGAIGVKTFDFNSNAIIINAATTPGNGVITVTETNSYGCTGIAGTFPVNVLGPSAISAITGDDIVCSLETAGYSVPAHTGSVYTWTLPTGAALIGDPSANSITVTFGSISGNISVREVNAAGCITDHTPLPVTVNPRPTAVISNSGTICQEDTFPINVSLTGTAPWSIIYAIGGAAQAPVTGINTSPYTFNATSAGTYTIVSVTDANLCTGTGIGNATVNYYPTPSATISGTTEICAGNSTLLTISLTGTAPYNFTYTDGTTSVPVVAYAASVFTVNVNPVVSTTYTVTSMTDSHGCDGTTPGTAIITVNTPPVLALTGTNLSCYGNNSGSIALTVTGSGTPFSYAWTGPDGYTAGVEDISGLAAGYYAVTVTDAKGCTATGNVTITQPPVLSLGNTGNITLLCHGATNGTGSFTVAGGTSPYTFTTTVNTTGATITTTATTADIANAGVGTITVQVTDNHGCIATSTINVTEPAALALSATLSTSIEGSHNINCFNGTTGAISLTVTGGVMPYLYSWTTVGGSGLTAGSANQSGLTAGTYNVTVTDANGCIATGSYVLTQPAGIVVGVTVDDNLIGTCALSEAQLTTTVTGGVELSGGGYTYSWSPSAGLSAANIANPIAKPASTTTYTVTVTDANGCTSNGSVTVAVAPVITAVAFANDNMIGDCALSEASLNVNVNGGEAPYAFSWTPATGLSAVNIQNPTAKPAATTTYTVTVTDANGCTAVSGVTINVAPALNVTVTIDDNLIGTCPASVAHLSATASGGEGGYTYSWNNPATLGSPGLANTTAKPAVTTTYTVTATDANGCTAQASVTVNVAPDLAVTASATDYIIGSCPSSTSVLTATVTGGEELVAGGYTYSWSPAAGLNYTNVQSPVAKPAATTTYTVTVTDRNGCTAISSVTINVNPPIVLTTVPVVYAGGYNITCNGASDGAVNLTANGGESPFTFVWTGPSGYNSANEDISGLRAGTYTVVVTDANNCTSTTFVDLIEPAVLSLGKTPDIALSCFGDATATGSFSVSGGTSTYTLSTISNTAGASITINPTSLTFTGGGAGEVTAGVTDANGCTAQATIYITQPAQLLPGSIDGTQEVCYLGDPVSLNQLTPATGGPGTIIYQWERSTDSGATWNIVSGANMASYDPIAGITVNTIIPSTC